MSKGKWSADPELYRYGTGPDKVFYANRAGKEYIEALEAELDRVTAERDTATARVSEEYARIEALPFGTVLHVADVLDILRRLEGRS